MVVIGLVGSAASGKSTVLRYLAERGIPVLDADRVAKALSVPGGPLYQAIVEAFGKVYVQANGELDRRKLRQHVFTDKAALDRLNDLSREVLRTELERRIHAASGDILVLEAIRLYEAGLDQLCDQIWQITCDRQVQIRRLMARDRITESQAEAMLASQEALLLGPYTLQVDNSRDFRYTVSDVEQSLNKIREKICETRTSSE